MGFQQGLSGLNAAAKNLDVIGNNVANSGTVGFKQSFAQFSDMYAASLSGSGSLQIGIGTKVANVVQQFTQGNVTNTTNPMDTAISGPGFFRMVDAGGAITYSRNGQFQLDKNGFLVNNQGNQVTGYMPVNGAIVQAQLQPLQFATADLTPVMSSNLTVGLNLDSRTALPVNTAFNPVDPASYNSSTSLSVYDSLGGSHVATLYFQRQSNGAVPPAATNNWNAYLTVDGAAVAGATAVPPATELAQLQFDSLGKLVAPVGGLATSATLFPASVTVDPTQVLNFDFGQSTQYGGNFGVNSLSQDGYASGRLSGFTTSSDGVILGRYTNGQSRPLGQIVLANFTSPQGLQPLGNNAWAETSASGQPLPGIPGSSSLGLLQSSAVEDSNVDLTAELVSMITAQRVYQANAQTIKAQDTILQTIVNLR
ncbi:MAG: flagellar hook protein FlgE [Gallionella sp.]|jgi:flagellar hook protein FlgE|nr:flagellar hook protein FlgE [Gallionella sp.]MCK9354518.1 flagellar hook protein FlgE [Gallionella sp.]